METPTAAGISTRRSTAGAECDWSWAIVRRDTAVSHPELAPLYRIWKEKCGTSALPCLSSFSLSDLEPWLGNLSIARMTGSDCELELFGCILTDWQGRDRSRVTLSDSAFGPVGMDAREMFETVMRMGVIALPCGSTTWRGQNLGWHGIALPLAGDSALICLFLTP